MIGVFYGGKWFKAQFGNTYGNMELDGILNETHDWSSEVTSNPVEEGAPVSDHIISNPDKLSLKCYITDTPIIASESASALSSNYGIAGNYTQPAFDLLKRLHELKKPVTVYTKFHTYESMVINSVGIPRSPGQGDCLEFDVDFIHLRMVASQVVDVPKGLSKTGNTKLGAKTAAQKNGGKKQAATVEPKKMSSGLDRLTQ